MSNSALPAVVSRTSISDLLSFTANDVEAVRSLIAPGAPDAIIKLVLYRCQQLGCDPLGKNIYAINRPKKTGKGPVCPNCSKRLFKSRNEGEGWYCWARREGCGATFGEESFAGAESDTEDNWVLQSSIDLLRSIADSSDGYQGQDGPYWCGQDGKWTDVWLGPGPPAAARIGILRASFAQPLYTVARFSSYAQTSNDGTVQGLWGKMPEVLISKCAEALAIRRAFPRKLGGIYIPEEMDQAENERNVTPIEVKPPSPALPAGQVQSMPAAKDAEERAQVEVQQQEDKAKEASAKALKVAAEKELEKEKQQVREILLARRAELSIESSEKLWAETIPAGDKTQNWEKSTSVEQLGKFAEAVKAAPGISGSKGAVDAAETAEMQAMFSEACTLAVTCGLMEGRSTDALRAVMDSAGVGRRFTRNTLPKLVEWLYALKTSQEKARAAAAKTEPASTVVDQWQPARAAATPEPEQPKDAPAAAPVGEKATPEQVRKLREMLCGKYPFGLEEEESGSFVRERLAGCGVARLEEMTVAQAASWIDDLDPLVEENKRLVKPEDGAAEEMAPLGGIT